MDPPPTRYVDREGAALAYQVVGSGAVDLVWYFEINMHLDLCWTDPHMHQLFEHCATYSRSGFLQRRGIGLSEPVDYLPSLEQQSDDLLAVMDEVGMRRALLVGVLSNAGVPALVAARAPHRVTGLALINPLAQGPESSEELVGWTPQEVEAFRSGYISAIEHWGSGETIGMWDPALDTPYNRRLIAMLERCSTSPAAAAAYLESVWSLDIRDILRSIQVPTWVIKVPTSPLPDAAVKHVSELIPGASLHVVPAAKPGAAVGEAWLPINHVIEEAATGVKHRVDADRFLGTVLFTDIVGSTELLSRLGDTTYRELRDDHERQVRFAVERGGGRLVKVIGDGTLSVFDSPTSAVRTAEEITRGATDLGIAVRAGVHTGEVERAGPDIHGLSVHIGARVGAAAGAGEVVVSRTVHDLVLGSGLQFTPRGAQELKGVPGSWELFTLGVAPAATLEDLGGPARLGALDRAALQTARRAPGLMRSAVRVGNAWQRRRAGSH